MILVVYKWICFHGFVFIAKQSSKAAARLLRARSKPYKHDDKTHQPIAWRTRTEHAFYCIVTKYFTWCKYPDNKGGHIHSVVLLMEAAPGRCSVLREFITGAYLQPLAAPSGRKAHCTQVRVSPWWRLWFWPSLLRFNSPNFSLSAEWFELQSSARGQCSAVQCSAALIWFEYPVWPHLADTSCDVSSAQMCVLGCWRDEHSMTASSYLNIRMWLVLLTETLCCWIHVWQYASVMFYLLSPIQPQ